MDGTSASCSGIDPGSKGRSTDRLEAFMRLRVRPPDGMGAPGVGSDPSA
jgi:hypothetical protein